MATVMSRPPLDRRLPSRWAFLGTDPHERARTALNLFTGTSPTSYYVFFGTIRLHPTHCLICMEVAWRGDLSFWMRSLTPVQATAERVVWPAAAMMVGRWLMTGGAAVRSNGGVTMDAIDPTVAWRDD